MNDLLGEIEDMGFDVGSINSSKYIVGKKEVGGDIAGLTSFSNAFWILAKKDGYGIEYYKGQLFMEKTFDNSTSIISYIQDNFKPH